MAVLNDEVREQAKKVFSELKNRVKLVDFTQEVECRYCRENRMLAEELASTSDKIDVETFDFVKDKDKARGCRVNKIPAMLVVGEKDYGIKFYGLPAGYEFASLMEAIKIVSNGNSGLAPESKEMLKKLSHPAHIQVFVTLTCPYCPQAVRLAHKLAFESELIQADMVESSEFPHLVNKYGVFAVPKVIINESIQFEGTLPEKTFIERMLS